MTSIPKPAPPTSIPLPLIHDRYMDHFFHGACLCHCRACTKKVNGGILCICPGCPADKCGAKKMAVNG